MKPQCPVSIVVHRIFNGVLLSSMNQMPCLNRVCIHDEPQIPPQFARIFSRNAPIACFTASLCGTSRSTNRFLYWIDPPLFQGLFHGRSSDHQWQNGRISAYCRIMNTLDGENPIANGVRTESLRNQNHTSRVTWILRRMHIPAPARRF